MDFLERDRVDHMMCELQKLCLDAHDKHQGSFYEYGGDKHQQESEVVSFRHAYLHGCFKHHFLKCEV